MIVIVLVKSRVEGVGIWVLCFRDEGICEVEVVGLGGGREDG